MELDIREIKEKDIWENFLLECDEKTFLNSWNWGEFQKTMGNKIWRFGIFENNKFISIALVVKTAAKRGTFLLVPHGPNIKIHNSLKEKLKTQILEAFLEELKRIAKKEKADFIRINPVWERNEENNKIFQKLGFIKAPIHAHPEASWKLDIRLPEEELLMNMRKTTRYLIKQTLKNNDLEIYQSNRMEDINVFDKLNQEVAKFQHFIPFSKEYIKNEFKIFKNDNQALIFFGKYKGEIIAAAFVLFWSNIGFYHHAALVPKHHKIPIAYLLQWEAIKEAKKRGCTLYDFWGYVSPKEHPKHPWAGPTLFKMGFGGRVYEYVKTQDLPLSKKYCLTKLFEIIRRIKRGL